jgi:hypothetical protein
MTSGFGIQDLVVALVALAALAWLVRRALRRRALGAACEECPGCASARAATRSGATPPRRDGIVIPITEFTGRAPSLDR